MPPNTLIQRYIFIRSYSIQRVGEHGQAWVNGWSSCQRWREDGDSYDEGTDNGDYDDEGGDRWLMWDMWWDYDDIHSPISLIVILCSYSITGECVPIRLFLSHLDLTPTYRSINNLFSVKYYLNLVLVDEEDRRYFKQHEVVFWRKAE